MSKHASGNCEWHSRSPRLQKLGREIRKTTNIWELSAALAKALDATVHLDRRPDTHVARKVL